MLGCTRYYRCEKRSTRRMCRALRWQENQATSIICFWAAETCLLPQALFSPLLRYRHPGREIISSQRPEAIPLVLLSPCAASMAGCRFALARDVTNYAKRFGAEFYSLLDMCVRLCAWRLFVSHLGVTDLGKVSGLLSSIWQGAAVRLARLNTITDVT